MPTFFIHFWLWINCTLFAWVFCFSVFTYTTEKNLSANAPLACTRIWVLESLSVRNWPPQCWAKRPAAPLVYQLKIKKILNQNSSFLANLSSIWAIFFVEISCAWYILVRVRCQANQWRGANKSFLSLYSLFYPIKLVNQ